MSLLSKHSKMWSVAILALILYLFGQGTIAEAAGVRPLVLEFSVRPGEKREFEITLTPGESEELVDLTLYEPFQKLNGSLVYELPSNPAFSATSWVTLENQTVRVLPGEESRVRGTIQIPFSASGSHTIIIMVEPRPPEIASGISFQIRYAVRLSIRVERSGTRPQAELSFLTVGPNQEGAPTILGRIKNPSSWDYLVGAEVTIRDQERRLIERVALHSAAGASAGSDATRVYPGAEVEFAGTITRPLPPGEYSLQAFFRYGENGQIVRHESFVVHPGEYTYAGFDELPPFIVSPSLVDHQLRAGERKSQILEFESLVGDPLRIELSLAEIRPDYEYSLLEWVELRSQSEFTLPPRVRSRLALTIAVPRESREGSFHGRVLLKAFNALTGDLLHEAIVPLNVLVGTEQNPSMQIQSIGVQALGEGSHYIAIDLYNSGNIALLPQTNALLFNEKGEFVERLELTSGEEQNQLLPLQARSMGAFTSQLEEGAYSLEIQIRHESGEILSEIHSFIVTKP